MPENTDEGHVGELTVVQDMFSPLEPLLSAPFFLSFICRLDLIKTPPVGVFDVKLDFDSPGGMAGVHIVKLRGHARCDNSLSDR